MENTGELRNKPITREEILWKGIDVLRVCHTKGENCSIMGSKEDRGVVIDRLITHETTDGSIIHRIAIPNGAGVNDVLDILIDQINFEGKMQYTKNPSVSGVHNLNELLREYYLQFPCYTFEETKRPDIIIFENLDNMRPAALDDFLKGLRASYEEINRIKATEKISEKIVNPMIITTSNKEPAEYADIYGTPYSAGILLYINPDRAYTQKGVYLRDNIGHLLSEH